MDKVSFPYRASSHLVLLHVIAESGAWARQNLDVNYDYQISSKDAHKMVPTAEVEFVGGNHVSTYAHRARGDSWVYLGQTMNYINHQLVVHPDSGINGISDMRGKKLGTRGTHPALNDWLFMKQRGLDVDREDIEIISQVEYAKGSMDPIDEKAHKTRAPLWQWIRDKKVDGALIGRPGSLFAEQAGLKVIDVEPMPMIWFTTISTSLGFVEKHPDIVQRFLKGIIEGIAFFKTKPEETMKIIRERYAKEGQMSAEQAAITYHSVAKSLEPRLMPAMKSIANVYEEAIRQDKDAKKINPLELWDVHHIRRIDDSGFIDKLYGNRKPDNAF